jgi:FAD:protein FMN transferase
VVAFTRVEAATQGLVRHPWSFAAALVVVVGACRVPVAGSLERFEYERPAMGTLFRVLLYAPDRTRADAAAEAAFGRVADLDAELSDFDSQSELSRLSALSSLHAPTEPVRVGEDLWRVLAAAQAWSEHTDGAFDVTVGPFVRLWRQARTAGELPDAERIEAARRSVGWRFVELDPAARTVRLLARDMRLDLGGIAKGDALDEALATLRAHGVERALVIGGGDMASSGPPPGRAGWRVEIEALGNERPEPASLELAHAALATSGDTYRHLDLDGVRYSHIVDPRTGIGLTEPIQVSVLATGSRYGPGSGASGATADAMATAISVMGVERGLELASRLGVEARIVVLEHGQPRARTTPGFARRYVER